MYRIIFVAKSGKWVIKITHFFGIFWSIVCGDNKKPQTFDNYQAAREKVEALGLDNIYKDFNTTTFNQFVRAIHVRPQLFNPEVDDEQHIYHTNAGMTNMPLNVDNRAYGTNGADRQVRFAVQQPHLSPIHRN